MIFRLYFFILLYISAGAVGLYGLKWVVQKLIENSPKLLGWRNYKEIREGHLKICTICEKAVDPKKDVYSPMGWMHRECFNRAYEHV